MSYLFIGIAIAAALNALFHLIIAIRAVTVGSGFSGFTAQFYHIGVITLGIVLALWLGPIGLAGIGLL